MIDNSWAWATARGLVRKNAVHGEEEARLVLEDWFDGRNERGTEQRGEASVQVEDPC